MPAVAAVGGDQIIGQCGVHQIPTPTGPQSAPGLPFVATLTLGLATSVLIEHNPAALQGSSGICSSHPPLADAFAVVSTQLGKVTKGSTSVFVEKKALAMTGSSCSTCNGSASVVTKTVTSVVVG